MNSILITGCNRGLGLGLVKSLIKQQQTPKFIFATCRNLEKADVSIFAYLYWLEPLLSQLNKQQKTIEQLLLGDVVSIVMKLKNARSLFIIPIHTYTTSVRRRWSTSAVLSKTNSFLWLANRRWISQAFQLKWCHMWCAKIDNGELIPKYHKLQIFAWLESALGQNCTMNLNNAKSRSHQFQI